MIDDYAMRDVRVAVVRWRHNPPRSNAQIAVQRIRSKGASGDGGRCAWSFLPNVLVAGSYVSRPGASKLRENESSRRVASSRVVGRVVCE